MWIADSLKHIELELYIKFSIEAEFSLLNRKLKAAEREVLPRAVSRSSKRAATTTRKEAGILIRQKYNLKSGELKKKISILGNSRSSSQLDKLHSGLKVSSKGMGLAKFGAKQNKKGVSFRVTKSRKRIAGAFIAKMSSGHVGVFVREEGKTSKGKSKIRELYSTSPVDVFSNKSFMKEVKIIAEKTFIKNFEREFKFLAGQL